MTKAKSTPEAAGTPFIASSFFGADALKTGFEKSAAVSDQFQSFGKDTIEACIESSMVAGQGIAAINNEIYAGARKSAADSLEAARTIAGMTSINQLFEFQQNYAKTFFADYVAQMNRINGLVSSLAKSSATPLQGRAEAFADLVKDSVAR